MRVCIRRHALPDAGLARGVPLGVRVAVAAAGEEHEDAAAAAAALQIAQRAASLLHIIADLHGGFVTPGLGNGMQDFSVHSFIMQGSADPHECMYPHTYG